MAIFNKTGLLLPKGQKPNTAEEPWYIVMLGTLFMPLGVSLFWLILFSALLNIDFFTHLALREKAEKIKEQSIISENITVIEFDQNTVNMQGSEADNRQSIFRLVDRLLNEYSPKAIVLDYHFSIQKSEKIKYRNIYSEKLIWASRPYSRGEQFYQNGFYDFFDTSEISLELQPQYSQNWGHDYFGLSPLINNAVTTVDLVVYQNKKLEDNTVSPSLALLAYAVGEGGITGTRTRTAIGNYLRNSVNREEEAFSTKSECKLFQRDDAGNASIDGNCDRLLKREVVFTTPVLPDYFPYYSAADFLGSDLNLPDPEQFEGKYIFIGSSWDKDSDHFFTSNAAISDVFKFLFSSANLLDLNGLAPRTMVPGVFLHAAILDNLLPSDFSFPEQQNGLLNFFHGITIILMCVIVGLIIALLIKFLTNKLQLRLKTSGYLYFICFVSCSAASFFVVMRYLSYVLIDLNTLVSPMIPFSLGVSIGAIVMLFEVRGDN